VEQTCEQVLIINRGKLVATDSVRNLENRARSGEAVLVEVAGRNGDLDPATVRQRLEMVSGVSRVLQKEVWQNRALFEVQSVKGRSVRGDLARLVVEAGWDLNEMRPAAMRLEEIFLELTQEESALPEEKPETQGAAV
jgi:ABC-2 type transport system ATP-binding protein